MKGLVHARLISRYKRFLADVRLDNGEVITVHCPNTGSMKNCVEENAEIWLSYSDNSKRKYRYTWEYMMTSRGHHIGINAGNANKLVQSAIRDDLVEPLTGYETIRPEVKYGDENSRIDLLLQDGKKPDCYVEVKSLTLLEDPPSSGIRGRASCARGFRRRTGRFFLPRRWHPKNPCHRLTSPWQWCLKHRRRGRSAGPPLGLLRFRRRCRTGPGSG